MRMIPLLTTRVSGGKIRQCSANNLLNWWALTFDLDSCRKSEGGQTIRRLRPRTGGPHQPFHEIVDLLKLETMNSVSSIRQVFPSHLSQVSANRISGIASGCHLTTERRGRSVLLCEGCAGRFGHEDLARIVTTPSTLRPVLRVAEPRCRFGTYYSPLAHMQRLSSHCILVPVAGPLDLDSIASNDGCRQTGLEQGGLTRAALFLQL